MGTLLLAFAVATTAPARAAQPPGENWVRVGTNEAIGIAALLTANAFFDLTVNAADQPRWQGPVLFDDAVHGFLTPASATARSRAGTLSTIGLVGLAAFPLVVDAGLVTWLGRGNADAAAQLALVDAEALALAWGISTVIERSVSRARPYAQYCAADPAHPGCSASASERNTSFLSGHTTVAFTMAAVLCVQHTRLDLFGSADAAVCPLAAAAATATGVLRIVAERHWATDVLAGAALGTSIGAIVALAHVRPRAAGAPQLTPVAGPGSFGLSFGGPF